MKKNNRKNSKNPRRKASRPKADWQRRGEVRIMKRRERNENIYEVPIAYGNQSEFKGPNNGRMFPVVDREQIAEVFSAGVGGAYKCDVYAIQPGLRTSFEWLSTIAKNFEEYEFKRLEFEFMPSVPTVVGGNVYLAVDFDCHDDAPITAKQFVTTSGSVEASIYRPVKLIVPRRNIKSLLKRHLVRTQNNGITERLLYDIGNLMVATDHVGDTNSFMGKIYVNYEIHFFMPQTDTGSLSWGALTNSNGTGSTAANMLGTPASCVPTGSIDVIRVTDTTFTLSPLEIGAEYLVQCALGGTTMTGLMDLTSPQLTPKTALNSVNTGANALKSRTFISTDVTALLTVNNIATAVAIVSAYLFCEKVDRSWAF